MKRVLILGLGIGVFAGCTDRLPTATATDPGRAEAPAVAGKVGSALVDDRADALAGIDDALDRVAPSLSDASAARPLTAALNGLRNALARADAEGIPTLLNVARGAVDRYARTGLDEADLDAIRLALDYAESALVGAVN